MDGIADHVGRAALAFGALWHIATLAFLSSKDITDFGKTIGGNAMFSQISPYMKGNDTVESILKAQHERYVNNAALFKYLYYTLRLWAGLAATFLPFIVPYSQITVSILAASVALATALDTIFVPRDKWKLYSKASDLLWVEQVRERGEYDKYKDRIAEILRTEEAGLGLQTGLQEMLDQIKKQRRQSSEYTAGSKPVKPKRGQISN